MSIFHNIAEVVSDAAYIWRQEMRQVFRDEGVLIFFIIVPLAYPLLYSWIYNNEVVHEVPVVVVDDSHSALSRQFVRMCDASSDVKVLCHAADMDEAKSLVSRQLAKGIYHIPSEFDRNISRMQQAMRSCGYSQDEIDMVTDCMGCRIMPPDIPCPPPPEKPETQQDESIE